MNSRQIAHFIVESCIPKYVLSRTRTEKPYVIGITGISPAVGKTTIASIVSHHLGHNRSSHIDLDNWILVDRKTRMIKGMAGIDPSVVDIDRLARSLKELVVLGQEISEPQYDHASGMPEVFEKTIKPSNIIIIAGATCFWDQLRVYLNFIVCIHPNSVKDEREMIISRNTKKRNYSIEKANIDYEITKSAYSKYILPYAKYSDIHLYVNKSYDYSIAS